MESSSHQGDLMSNTHLLVFLSVEIYLIQVRKCCSCQSLMLLGEIIMLNIHWLV